MTSRREFISNTFGIALVTASTWPIRAGQAHSTQQQRSEEHTSELQSQSNLVCRLLLEKKTSLHHERYAYRTDIRFLSSAESDRSSPVPAAVALSLPRHFRNHPCRRRLLLPIPVSRSRH